MKQIAEEHHDDPEAMHSAADRLMMETLNSIGYGAGIEVFKKMSRWYA